MEALKIKAEQTRQAYLANPTKANKEAYIKASNAYEQAKRDKKIEEFKTSIEAKNEYYKVINNLAPKVIEILKNYKGNIATTQGQLRKDFTKLLPVHENVRFYVRTFGSGTFYSENLELYYNIGHTSRESHTFYLSSEFTPYEEIDFDKEYKIGLEYLNTFLEASRKLDECTKPNYLVKEFIKNSNLGLYDIRF